MTKLTVIVKVKDHLIDFCTHSDTHINTDKESSLCFQGFYFSPEGGALPLYNIAQRKEDG